MLDILRLDIFRKSMAAKSVLRLKKSEKLKHDHVEHSTVYLETILVQGTDYMLPKSNFGKASRTRIPSKDGIQCIIKIINSN